MSSFRTLAIAALIALSWAFSPYLEYLGDRPTQDDFDGLARMGLFKSSDAIEVLVTIDAEKDLRTFDVQANIKDKILPLSWRLSPTGGNHFDIKNREGTVVAAVEFPNNDTMTISPIAGASEMTFQRFENGPYRQYLIEYESNGVGLAATVFAPNATGTTIGIVMIHGSGRSDRNNLWYVAQADYLARRGFTVLLPDKRGSGRSGGLWKTATMKDLADDANAAVQALSEMDEVSVKHIGLVGLSQGGHIAPVAASENETIEFVVNVVGSLLSFNEGLDHESRNLFLGHTPEMLTPPLIFIASQVARARIPIWWFKNGAFDSKPYWTNLAVPALIIWGEEDEYDNVAVKQSTSLLEEINRHRQQPIDLKIYPGMGHGLFDDDGWISEDYLSFLADWIEMVGADIDMSRDEAGKHSQ